MAGLLDNEFMRLVLSGSPYMQSREQQRREDLRSQQYAKLLGEYPMQGGGPNFQQEGGMSVPGGQQLYQQQPQGFPGEAQAPAGLIQQQPGGTLPNEFFARAAAIPGYGGLINQLASNQAAMERQRQAQNWSTNNMTLAENVTARQREAETKWRQDRQEFEYNNTSAYQRGTLDIQQQGNEISRGQLGVSQQRLGLDQQRLELERQAAANKGTFAALPPTEQIKIRQQVMPMMAGFNTLGDIAASIERNPELVNFSSVNPEARTRQEQYRLAVLPIVRNILSPGTEPGPKLQEEINSIVGDLTSPGSPEAKIKKLRMFQQKIQEQYSPYAAQFGFGPMTETPGSSAWAKQYAQRTTSKEETPNIVPFSFSETPGGAATGRRSR